jgi:hypothetical protein
MDEKNVSMGGEMVGNAPDLADEAVQGEIRTAYADAMSGEHGSNGRVHALEDLAGRYKTTVEAIEGIVSAE